MAVPYNTHSDKDSGNDESGEDDTLVGSEVDNCEEGPVPRSSNFHAEETGEYEAKHGFSDQHDIDDTQVGLDEMEEVDISEEGTEAIEGSEHGSDQLSDLDIDDTQVGSDEMEEVDSSEEETGAIEGSKHVSDQLSDLQDIDDGSDEDLWVVASLDWPGANVYRTLLSSQPRNEVIITDLNSQLSELVHEFHQSTKKMPIRIIYFRNGVTEDQLRHTFEHEIDAIRMVCPGARITFVVVAQKSHEFLRSEIGEDCNLTKFFCSHVDEKSNTHVGYRVLHDDNYFTPDKILSLCTDLLIRRVRWRFPQLSMAPAAYIAHETALMACDYVEKNRLDDGTFFLPRIFI
ncbi:protein argonaute MEL1-like isoform X2 [Panicum virgatum]|uniref:protein argonaute MEL1-like isoform X2 n=1 Tax=Panicum virgatum TaxID=38727 RepID=UPI0019D542A4|nr:protein argonaute MEL1-like isoform X2 [Panicum virgatum]